MYIKNPIIAADPAYTRVSAEKYVIIRFVHNDSIIIPTISPVV